MPQKIKALLVFEQCNPEWPSFPLSAYGLFRSISHHIEATLVTHIRNKENLEKVREAGDDIVYIEEPGYLSKYWKCIDFITQGKGTNWPLLHALSYPIYADFNRKVYQRFADRVRSGEYDLVHGCSPVIPRYPVKLSQVCEKVPFILGPVNGGLSYPKGFESIATQEFSKFNFLRFFGNFIPGYRQTYQSAETILVGNTPTIKTIQKATGCDPNRCHLFFENGLPESFFDKKSNECSMNEETKLLYVGRLVPCKGIEMLIQSIPKLNKKTSKSIKVTLVGEGPLRKDIENLIDSLGVSEQVKLIGNVDHEETRKYYQEANIFCFPSVREFGGTVIMEAFAHSLPAIVINYGGPAEYVQDDCGFRIDPLSEQHIIEEIALKVELLASDIELYQSMSKNAYQRAQGFLWKNKAKELLKIYEDAIESKKSR